MSLHIPDFPVLAFLGGHWELIVVLVVLLLLFGSRIPGLARSLGQGIVEFRKGLKPEEEGGKEDRREQQQLPPSETERSGAHGGGAEEGGSGSVHPRGRGGASGH